MAVEAVKENLVHLIALARTRRIVLRKPSQSQMLIAGSNCNHFTNLVSINKKAFDMKKILILILTIATISSCSKDDDSLSKQIMGEWKLMEAKFYGLEGGSWSEGSIDYSNENIIYDFQSNGTLSVSGGDNAGYSNGEYEYFFGKDHLGGMNDPEILLVKINDSKWTYDLTNGKMTLGQSYIDGPNLVFERN